MTAPDTTDTERALWAKVAENLTGTAPDATDTLLVILARLITALRS